MGLISKAITLILSFLLFISLILGALSFTIYSSLEYNEVEKNAAPFVENFLRESLKKSPSTTDKILDTVLSIDWVQKIPFTDTLKQALTEKLKSEEIDNISLEQESKKFIQEMYYAEYDCDYWNCFNLSETPFFLVSQKSQLYWYKNLKYIGIISLVLIALLFLFVGNKKNFFVLMGILSLLSSLPIWGIRKIISIFSKGDILNFVNIIFSKSNYVATILTSAGIILIALAILFGLFGLGFKIFSWIDSIKTRAPKIKIPRKQDKIKKEESDKLKGSNLENETESIITLPARLIETKPQEKKAKQKSNKKSKK